MRGPSTCHRCLRPAIGGLTFFCAYCKSWLCDPYIKYAFLELEGYWTAPYRKMFTERRGHMTPYPCPDCDMEL